MNRLEKSECIIMKHIIRIALALVATTTTAQNEFSSKAQEFMSMVTDIRTRFNSGITNDTTETKRITDEYAYITICDSIRYLYGNGWHLPKECTERTKRHAAIILASAHNSIHSPTPDVLGILDKIRLDENYAIVLTNPYHLFAGGYSRWAAVPSTEKDPSIYVTMQHHHNPTNVKESCDIWQKLRTEQEAREIGGNNKLTEAYELGKSI